MYYLIIFSLLYFSILEVHANQCIKSITQITATNIGIAKHMKQKALTLNLFYQKLTDDELLENVRTWLLEVDTKQKMSPQQIADNAYDFIAACTLCRRGKTLQCDNMCHVLRALTVLT